MNAPKTIKLIASLVSTLTLLGCNSEIGEGPSAKGSFKVCHTKQNIDDPNYQSARISYPCDTAQGPFPTVTVVAGYRNPKEWIYWLSDHLVSHGYVAMTATPNNIVSGPFTNWIDAHKASLNMLLSENQNPNSPIQGLVIEDALGTVGFSFGGGGAILAANEFQDQIKASVGLASYINPSFQDFSTITANTLIVGGDEDTTTLPEMVNEIYEGLPSSIDKTLALLKGSTHIDGVNFGTNHEKYKTIITSWLNIYLKGDDSYRSYIDGEKYEEQEEAGWYTSFLSNLL